MNDGRFKGMSQELKLRRSSLRFHGKLNTRHILSPNTTYSVYLIFDFYDRHALYGFIEVSLKFSSQTDKILSESKFQTNLERAWEYEGGGRDDDDSGKTIVTKGEDGFRELKLGEFYDGGNDGGVFEMSLKQDEIVVLFLSFLGIEFRPK
ncbi:F-box protein PP2-B11 [Morus notabilis]|uniref:F-box protein PP2-B11 n=1 Tax=Morus notabilis TaxID=981085 RepID=UPI000CECEDBA|nr:F-box protein PP2-B11 [Morus notabilis]